MPHRAVPPVFSSEQVAQMVEWILENEERMEDAEHVVDVRLLTSRNFTMAYRVICGEAAVEVGPDFGYSRVRVKAVLRKVLKRIHKSCCRVSHTQMDSVPATWSVIREDPYWRTYWKVLTGLFLQEIINHDR